MTPTVNAADRGFRKIPTSCGAPPTPKSLDCASVSQKQWKTARLVPWIVPTLYRAKLAVNSLAPEPRVNKTPDTAGSERSSPCHPRCAVHEIVWQKNLLLSIGSREA